jgi:hypothetical protein
MTLRLRKVDDCTVAHHSEFCEVPSGWEIAPGDADDARVCRAHPWQSHWLVIADGRMIGTPLHPDSQYHGICFSWLLIQCSGKFKEVAHNFTQAGSIQIPHASFEMGRVLRRIILDTMFYYGSAHDLTP